MVEGETQILHPGMCFSIEPGIYLPGRFGWVGWARQAVRTSTARGSTMKYPTCLVAGAAVLGFALAGCQPAAGPPTAGSSASVPGPSSSGLAAIIQAAVEDRNGTVLDIPPAARLAEGQMTAAYPLPQIATFRASGDGWQLDSIVPTVHGGGLPMSVVEG